MMIAIWMSFLYFGGFIIAVASIAAVAWTFVAIFEELSQPMTRPVPPGPPFCRDCRWCLPARNAAGLRRNLDLARCMHASAARDPAEALVTRVYSEDNAHYCSTMRKSDKCGPEGKNWAGYGKEYVQ